MRIEQLRREFDLNIRYVMFPLHPDIPDDGLALAELFAGRIDVDAMSARLRQIAGENDLALGERMFAYNSRRAQELGKWAEEMECPEVFNRAVYQAYFVAGKNIAQIDVLADIAASAGLDPEQARSVLNGRRNAKAVDRDWKHALDQEIMSVPTLVYKNRKLVGFQPYERYRNLIAG